MSFITEDTPSSERSSNSSSSQGYPLSMDSQPRISTTAPSSGVPLSSSVWESILGPEPTGAQEPEENCFTLHAFHSQPSTPSFKPDYSHPSYNLEQVDPAKRSLFQAPAQKLQLSSQTWRKVCNLGNPYELPTDEGGVQPARRKAGTQHLHYCTCHPECPPCSSQQSSRTPI